MVRPFNWAIHIARSQAGRAQQPANPQSLHLCHRRPNNTERSVRLNWWNPLTWSRQQQAQAFTIAVIVVAVVAVVATGGIASPLAAAAVGAALSTTSYTFAAGDKETLKGAVLTAALGAVAGDGGRRSPEFGSRKHSGKRCNRWNY